MDKEFKLISSNKKFVGYIKSALIILLVVMETLICAQSCLDYPEKGGLPQLISVFVCCIALAVIEIVNTFAVKAYVSKVVLFGFELAVLLAICLLTGNTYLSALYCIILTQLYIKIDELKNNAIVFGVSCVLYIASFVGGWVIVNSGATVYESVVSILSGVLVGLAILGAHFAVTNFILRFYSNNAKLRAALKEADESKARLKEVYEQLSDTAVYEERNRIAKDIHDNAGHSMTTVIMQTEAAKLLIEKNPDEARARIISANMQAKNALEQMRESVHLLAGKNRTLSLREEIEEVIARTIDGTGLKIRCSVDDVNVGETKFRYIINTVKECIANGIRHGKATAFYIEVKKSLSGTSVLISDNGCGAADGIKEGFGLKGIREKAEALGGRCVFSSEAEEGFEVEITLPPDEIKAENGKDDKIK